MSWDSPPATHYLVRNGYTINFYKKGKAVSCNKEWDEAVVKSVFAGQSATLTLKSKTLLDSLEPLLDFVFRRGAQAHSKAIMRLLKYGEQ
jgi:hypothetical protein